MDVLLGGLRSRDLAPYFGAQVAGGLVGVVLANLMFALAPVSISTHVRSAPNLWLSEVLATFGLLLVIFGLSRAGRASAAPFAVGAYITGAYFFTSSTSFANPAVTLARTLSNTFAGIAPESVPGFIVAQCLGAIVALGVLRALWPSERLRAGAAEAVVPHTDGSWSS